MIVSTQNGEDWICFAQKIKMFFFFPFHCASVISPYLCLMALFCAVGFSSLWIFKLAPHDPPHLFLYLDLFSPFSLSAFPSLLHLMVVVCLCVVKHRSDAPVFLLQFEELVWGGVLGLLALLCMGRCMKLTPPSHWQVHTSSANNT